MRPPPRQARNYFLKTEFGASPNLCTSLQTNRRRGSIDTKKFVHECLDSEISQVDAEHLFREAFLFLGFSIGVNLFEGIAFARFAKRPFASVVGSKKRPTRLSSVVNLPDGRRILRLCRRTTNSHR